MLTALLPPACAVRGLLAGRVPPEGPWELHGVELLSQRELYHQVLLLLHLLPRDLLLLQVRPAGLIPLCPIQGNARFAAEPPGTWPALPLAQSPEVTQVPLSPSPASLRTAIVRKCWTGSSSVGSWWLRR